MTVCQGRPCLCLATAIAIALALPALSAQRATPQAPTFRSGVTMVPLDVRVLDWRGEPITDLTRDDFVVFEDDVPQTIQQFARAELAPEPAAVMAPLTLNAQPPVAAPLVPQNRRVFLFVVGRGRQTGPVRVFDALKTFVRDRLLPQDQVAVMGYNRATDFTTDHASLVELLDRYDRLHTRVEALIAQNQNLVLGVLGPQDMPAFIQDTIDEVFGTGIYGGRTLPEAGPGARSDQARAARTAARSADARVADQAGASMTDVAPRPGVLPGLGTALDQGLLGQYYEDYLGQAVSALTDLGNVHKGLDYLRHVDGEKHLLLVTVAGDLGLWDTTDEDRLAALAADARVALDLIHTGGVVAAPVAGPQGPIQAVPTASQVFNQTFKVKGIRALAELSGGQAWAFRTGEYALDQLDRATRFQYLIGYVPTNATQDGEYRKVRVEVRRPGVKLVYRRGYFAGAHAGAGQPD